MSLQKTRKYNLTLILDTRGYEAAVETLEEKVTELLKESGGEVESLENLGRRDFSRVTEKGHTGDTYLQVDVSGPAELPATFLERVRLDKLIKRSMFKSI
ncbi:MAG: 30S ribosomal protein S6 [Opitutales bacterium]|jgi:small subunit ribosomal protein S6